MSAFEIGSAAICVKIFVYAGKMLYFSLKIHVWKLKSRI